MRFTAELVRDGRTATGITVPDEVLAALGGGRRPAVTVTLGEHTFRTMIGSMGGVAKIPVSAAVRAAAGVEAGQLLQVGVELDLEPRTVSVPPDLATAMVAVPAAQAFFEGLSPSRQKAYVTWVEQTKAPQTRQRRVEQTVELLADERPQR